MQTISERVNVVLASDRPISLHWRNRDYRITKIGLRHEDLEGNTLVHLFSVLSGTIFFKLKFNTKNLAWTLVEFDDNAF